jgi:hypothetical protein
MDEQAERHHRPPERPQNDQAGDFVVDVELVPEAADHRQLERDQPQPARQQEA